MNFQNKKCSFAKHSEKYGKITCVNCNMNLCKECEIFHSNFCKEHLTYNIEKEQKDIFNIFCQEPEHKIKFEYFCRSHNILCCARCITKIKNEKNGKHTDCDICNIEDIVESKKNKFNENIETLTELSNSIQASIDNIKNIYDKIEENKEEIKLQIQKLFTKIRSELNNKEEELLLEVDNIYDNTYFKENFIKEIQKLPKKIQSVLDKKPDLNLDINDNEDNKDYKLISLINDCLNIENAIEEINVINLKIKETNNYNNLKIEFISNEEKILNDIKNFGVFGRNIFKEFLKSSIIKGNFENQNSILNWIKEKVGKEEINFE